MDSTIGHGVTVYIFLQRYDGPRRSLPENITGQDGMLDRGIVLLSKPFTIEQLAQKVRQVLDALS